MKRLIAVVTAILTVVSLFALSFTASAEGTETISYGTDSLDLRVIDTFEGEDAVVDGWQSLGTATIKDGKIVVESAHNMFDAYGFKTAAIQTSDWSGMKFIVFKVTNTSDGDVFFCYQPSSAEGGNLYNSSQLASKYPVKLYNTEKQELKDAKWSGIQTINNRDAIIIPWKFTGYIFMSIGNLAGLNTLTTSAMPENGSFFDYGIHMKPDDASFVELTIDAVYACADLPEFHAPEKPTEAPTPAPATEPATPAPATEPATVPATEPVTEEPTEITTESATVAPVTEAETTPAADTGASTAAGTEAGTAAAEGGCASVIGASAVIVLLAACAAFVRKH